PWGGGRGPGAGQLRQKRGERLIDSVGGGEVIRQAGLDQRLSLERDPDGFLEAQRMTDRTRGGARRLDRRRCSGWRRRRGWRWRGRRGRRWGGWCLAGGRGGQKAQSEPQRGLSDPHEPSPSPKCSARGSPSGRVRQVET